MRSLIRQLILFVIGGFLYWLMEIVWRGRSHSVMAVIGGICFLLCGAINEEIPWEMPLWEQGFLGALMVTAVELVSGFICNICFRMNLWDYSGMPFNVMGQICLQYALLWIPVAIMAIMTDDLLRYWLFHDERPHYRLL